VKKLCWSWRCGYDTRISLNLPDVKTTPVKVFCNQPPAPRVIRCRDMLFSVPEFIHDFGNEKHHRACRGSLAKHIAVEQLLYKLQVWLINNDAMWTPFYKLFSASLSLLFGLNCNFPRRDVALFVAWKLRKGYYDYVGTT
jgi:hypothetical protein